MSDDITHLLVLSCEDPAIKHCLERVRDDDAYCVKEVRSSHGVLAACSQHLGSILLLRETQLPVDAAEFLTSLRLVDPSVFIILCHGPTKLTDPAACDLRLPEPLRTSVLMDALAYGRARRVPARPTPSDNATPNAPAPSTANAWSRLLTCAHRLSELERDQDQLLTTAMEMCLEIAQATKGALLLTTEGGTHLFVARRRGFEGSEGPSEAIRMGSTLVGEVAQTGRAIVGTVEETEGASALGVGESFLIVPLLERRSALGVVILGTPRAEQRFSRTDLEIVQLLARQIAVNLANARRIEDLNHLTVVDPLTGLFNRRFFDRQFTLELERARRYDRQVTLALLDIDNFKKVNDKRGYAAGDALIREVSEIIRSNVREVDIVTRWGGDEFAILLPETGRLHLPSRAPRSSLSYVERIREAVESEHKKIAVVTNGARITVSAGVSTYPTDAGDREVLFQKANQALRRAKRTGNNRICLAQDDDEGAGISVTMG